MEMWFCCLYLELYMLLMPVDFFCEFQKWIKLHFVLFCEFQEWTVLLFVIIVPFSFSHSLHGTRIPQYWHSMESSSKHFFYICTFCITFFVHWVWVHFDNIVRFCKNPFIDVHLLITVHVSSRKEMPVSSQYSVIQ